MLVSEVADRVKRQFGDEIASQIDDTDIIRWCNDAQKEIALQNKLLQTISTIPTVIGTSEYTLPVDLLALRGVRYDKLRLTMVTMDDIDTVINDSTTQTGIPGYYWTFSDAVTVWPTPDAVKNVTIYYTKVPDELLLVADSLTLPPQYDNRVVEYCIGQAAELDDDLEHYQLKMSQFQSGIDANKNQLEQVEQDDIYPSITYDQNEYYA